MFSEKITVNFDEADPGGILFFGRFFNLTHRLIESFVRHSGIDWKDWYQHPEWAVPIRHAESDYLSPMIAGHSYTGQVKLVKLGGSSVKFETTFSNANGPCAVVKTTHAFVDIADINNLKPRKIPTNIREKLKAQLSQ